jgi:hypothetical protein
LSKKFVKPCLTWVAYLTLVTFDLMFLWILVCQHHSHVFGGSLRFNFLDDCFIKSVFGIVVAVVVVVLKKLFYKKYF